MDVPTQRFDPPVALLTTTARQFQIEAEQTGTPKILKSQDWSFTWSNTGLQWPAADDPLGIVGAVSFMGVGVFTSNGIEGMR